MDVPVTAVVYISGALFSFVATPPPLLFCVCKILRDTFVEKSTVESINISLLA